MDPSKFSICSDTHACEQTNITVSRKGIKCDMQKCVVHMLETRNWFKCQASSFCYYFSGDCFRFSVVWKIFEQNISFFFCNFKSSNATPAAREKNWIPKRRSAGVFFSLSLFAYCIQFSADVCSCCIIHKMATHISVIFVSPRFTNVNMDEIQFELKVARRCPMFFLVCFFFFF